MSRMGELYHEATIADALGYQSNDTRALRAELARVKAERNALACVLKAVPTEPHNAAVLASGVDFLEYTHGMEHGLGIIAEDAS